MRVVFVGVGRIGAAHADVVRRHPAIDSLALVDANPDRARAVAEKLGVESAVDVDEAMARADAMVVTAPTAVHPDMIVRSLRRGIPVFCEKPVATDVAGHRRVLAEVSAAGVPVQIGFQRRFDAGYAAVRRAVAAGQLGELRRVHLVTARSCSAAVCLHRRLRRHLPRSACARLRHRALGHRSGSGRGLCPRRQPRRPLLRRGRRRRRVRGPPDSRRRDPRDLSGLSLQRRRL